MEIWSALGRIGWVVVRLGCRSNLRKVGWKNAVRRGAAGFHPSDRSRRACFDAAELPWLRLCSWAHCRARRRNWCRLIRPAKSADSTFDDTGVDFESDVLIETQTSHDFTMRLRGRVDTDAIWSTQSPANEATFGELGDVVGLRRARIGVEGELGSDRRYIAEIDLASGEVVPRDVYFAWGDVQDFGESQLGHLREPFSLEGQTSAQYFAFMERSPINVLDPARNWGLGLFQESLDENSTLGMGVFYAGTGSADLQGGEGSAVDFTGRLTTAPINEGNGERLLALRRRARGARAGWTA